MNENNNTGGAIVATTPNAPAEARVMRPASIEELKEQVKTIQQCMKGLMKADTHFGKLPGCGDKMVLLKPGAELILTLFHISAEPQIERISDGFDVTYRVTVIGRHIPTGNIVGYGVGEASTSEKKYKWKEATCHEEWEDTPETRRQIAYTKYRDGNVQKKEQIRQNPADICNTVLKMSKKRALVDLCLTATACSDIFVQDLDDPDFPQEPQQPPPYSANSRFKPPQRTAPAQNAAPQQQRPANAAPAYNNGGGNISEAQCNRLFAIANKVGLSKDEIGFIVFQFAHVNRADQIPRDLYEATVAAIQAAVPGQVIPPEDGDMFNG